MDVGLVGARAVGVALQGQPLAGSMSSSVVHRGLLDGKEVVLKATCTSGQREPARRELAFYLTLADGLPVRTPELLRYVDTDEVTAFVLTAHTPSPPAAEWTLDDWLAIARELAVLHDAPLPTGTPWEHEPWVRRVLAHPQMERAEPFWSDTAPALEALRHAAALGETIDAVEDTFVHGDCHVGNVLRAGAELVWSDWQVTGRGNPACDLAFLWSRAHADGADPPYEQMVRAYLARRPSDGGTFRRALVAAELAIGLFGWPEYAVFHPPAEQLRIKRRVAELAGLTFP